MQSLNALSPVFLKVERSIFERLVHPSKALTPIAYILFKLILSNNTQSSKACLPITCIFSRLIVVNSSSLQKAYSLIYFTLLGITTLSRLVQL